MVRARTNPFAPTPLFTLKPSALGISGLIDFLPAFIPGFRPAYICPLFSLSLSRSVVFSRWKIKSIVEELVNEFWIWSDLNFHRELETMY